MNDAELGGFLRHRRSLVQPRDVGLPSGSGRRVPGLRREELAIAAGVSPDHYQRIEQCRVTPSRDVLDALATVLSLDDVERAHLHDLASNAAAPRSRAPKAGVPATDHRRHQALVDSFTGPAYVLDHRRDVIAWNALAAALHLDFAALPRRDRNMIWLILTDPAMRALYSDWETAARGQVGLLRRAGARCPNDPRIEELVGRLSTHSPEFARWWPLREVREKTSGAKTLDHPKVGTLHLEYQTLHPAGARDIEVFLYHPSDSDAADKLAQLRGV